MQLLAVVVAAVTFVAGSPVAAAPMSAVPVPGPLGAPVAAGPAPAGMELVWSDEFDGHTIDRTNWAFDLGAGGWGNGEAQHYTDRPQNARLADGQLVIELHEEQFEGSSYTSARLTTECLRQFQYGRVEVRLQVPPGVGTWPAFWLLGAAFDPTSADPAHQWPQVGEIDVMEHVGREPDLVIGALHGPGYSGAGGLSRWHRTGHDLDTEFHVHAVEWDADGIRWFVDGEQFYAVTPATVGERPWVFDQPFFIIVNLALGGTLGGPIAVDLELPVQYRIDYVRVFQPVADSPSPTAPH